MINEEGASVEGVNDAMSHGFLLARFISLGPQNEARYKRRHTYVADVMASPISPTAIFPSPPLLRLLKVLPTAPPKMIPLGSSLSAGHGRCFFAARVPMR